MLACHARAAASLRRYAEFVSNSVGSIESLSPPAPPLGRYKRELWVKSVDAEAKGKRAPLLDDEAQRAAALPGNTLAPLGGQRAAAVTTESLVVRMNCLAYLADALPQVKAAVQERCAAPFLVFCPHACMHGRVDGWRGVGW